MKKIALLFSFAIASMVSSFAQTNVALNATASHTGGGAGVYAPSAYNDGIYNAFGLPWGWTNAGDTIEYTWTLPQNIYKVIFRKDGRPMRTCEIEYWDGVQYVSLLSYSSLAGTSQDTIDSVVFTSPAITTRLRFSDVRGAGNPNFREIEVIDAPTASNNAAVIAVKPPEIFCAGSYNVLTEISNQGTNQIDSLEIHWEVNGVAQPSYKYIALLDTVLGLNPDRDEVDLGMASFVAGSNSVKVWTALPNGVPDTVNGNDTILKNITSAAAPRLSVLSTGTNDATFDVSNFANSAILEYEYDAFGFARGTGTAGTSTTFPFTIGGLSSGTAYDIYVRTDCGSNDTSSWVGPITFNTAVVLPFIEDFEAFNPGIISDPSTNNWSATPYAGSSGTGFGWEIEEADGSNAHSSSTGPLWDHTNFGSISQYAYMETSGGTTGNVADLSSPPIYIDPSYNDLKLSFWYFMYGSNIDQLYIIADTNGVEDTIATIIGEQQVNQTDNWLEAVYYLSGYAGKTVSLKFKGVNAACCTGDIAIDDVSLTPVPALSASLMEIIEPAGFICQSTTPVVVVENTGSTTLTSVDIITSVNGATTSTTFPVNLLTGDVVNLTLPTITLSPGTLYDISFYTTNPNGGVDGFTEDDTVAVTGLQTGLAGAYTIDSTLGATSSNFISFSSLADALMTRGVCGPTTVSIASGTYNDVFRLTDVPGLSASNTLSIDGGDPSLVILTDPLGTERSVVDLNGVSYTTIKNMTVASAVSSTNRWGIRFSGAAKYDSIVNVEVLMSTTTTTSVRGIGASASETSTTAEGDNASFITVMDCYVEGAERSVHFEGPAAGSWNSGNTFLNNTFTLFEEYGMYFDQQDSLTIIGNTISEPRSTSNTSGYGIYNADGMNFKIKANNIQSRYYGIYCLDANSDKDPDFYAEIVNNMVSNVVNRGVYLTDPFKINIFHNSVNADGVALEISGSFSDSLDCRNNVLVSATAEALDMGSLVDTLVFLQLDYNVYHTSGSNLIYEDGTSYADLAAYQTAQPLMNANSIEGDPQFLSSNDLHIIGGLINDLGDNSVFVLTDIDGESRPFTGSTVVDPGADEHDPPSCLPPTDLLGQDPALDGFTLTWNGVGMNYEYLIVPAGADPTTGTYIAIGDDSVTVTGLQASSAYDVYVREACGRGIYSLPIGPLTIRTLNGIPYMEDFETFPRDAIITNPGTNDWTVTPYNGWGWYSEDATGANENSTGTGPLYDHTLFGTPGGLYLYTETSGGTVGDTAEVVSPIVYVDPSINVFELKYWYFNFGVDIDRMDVYIRSNGTDVLLGSYVGQQQTAQTEEWRLGSHFITGYGGQDVQIVFKGVNVPCCAGDIAIDDVSLTTLLPNDAGIVDVLNPPLPICPGVTTPVVGLRNFGGDTLRSVNVVVDVNGAKDTISYTGAVAPGDTVPVTLGNITFNSGTNYDLTFYTYDPNGLSDGSNENDTLRLLDLNTGLVGNYTIDSSAVTAGSNFQSFTDFADAVNDLGLCGPLNVDVVVGSGPYNEQLILENVEGSGVNNLITINGHGETIAFAPTNSNERAVIIVDNVAGVIIDSLNVDADQGGTYGWGVQLTGTSHHIAISNARIQTLATSTSTSFAPIIVSGSRTSATTDSEVEYININNCRLIGGYYGFAFEGSSSIMNKYISVEECTVMDFYSYGIRTLSVDSSLIELNDISRPNRTNTTTFYGIYQSDNENTIVNRNAIHNSHDQLATNTSAVYPIYTTGDASSGIRNLISNNLIYNINSNGTTYGIYDLGSDGANYVNNTVSLDNTASTSGTTRGFYQSAASSSSSFVNNVISVTRGGSGTKHGIYLNSTSTNMYVDYNNVYMNSAGSGSQYYGRYSGDQADLTAWQGATPSYGVNSYEVDPQFKDLANDDYTPGDVVVVLNNTALSVPEVPVDFYGTPRPAAPDLGAIEYEPVVGNNLALRDFIAPVFNTDSCYGATEDLIVSVVNFGGAALDFTVDTTDIVMNVSGANTQSISFQINDNSFNGGQPLAIGSQIDVTIGTVNLSNAGVYNFEGYLTLANDTFPGNDTLRSSINRLAASGGVLSGVDSICSEDTSYLSVDKYVGELQWQEWDGTNWVDINGATGKEFKASPAALTQYRVLACGVAPSDTATVTPIILNTAPIAMGDTTIVRCGDDGAAIATASSANPDAQFVWYTSANGEEEADTTGGIVSINEAGDSLTFNRFGTVQGNPAIDTFWVAEVVALADGVNSVKISEVDPRDPDALEIQNVSGSPVDVTGWQVAISNNYTNINSVNANVQTLSGILAPNQTMYWTDGTVNAWGSNILWNESGSPGWAIVIDAQGNIVDYMAFEWTAADIMGQNITVGSFTNIQPGVAGAWVGDGAVANGTASGNSLSRVGSNDNDDATDWIQNSADIGAPNAGLLTPFPSGRCESPRAMAVVMVDCVVGIENGEALTSSLEVFPNPSEGIFTLSINSREKENFNLNVRNVKGQLMFSKNVNVSGVYKADMDFSEFAKGVYFLEIQTGKETHIEKLIIQ
jgi:hypothetical protein